MNRTKILGLTSGYRSGFLSTRQAVTSQKAFSLVSAIELSKTPIHTIYIGIWASMAFWIGITGYKRFALPYTEFLLHEGKLFTAGSAGSVQDTVDFDKRYKEDKA
ncbi:ATP-dependent Clp protease proteolytic subunit [Candidatus Saccharibacteria bacterium]|nr:ATP-dependent Clp protease proteolytic subunit [Candidatus Saccharibacteria bacterium]